MGVASSIVLSTLANMKGELSVDCTAAGRCFYTLRVFKPRLKVKGVPFCHCDLPSSSYIKHVLHSCTEGSLYYPWQLPAPLVSPHYMMWPLLPCVWAASCLSPPSSPAAWHWSPIILWRHQYLLICTWSPVCSLIYIENRGFLKYILGPTKLNLKCHDLSKFKTFFNQLIINEWRNF